MKTQQELAANEEARHNKDRFGMSEQLAKILENTAKQFDSEV